MSCWLDRFTILFVAVVSEANDPAALCEINCFNGLLELFRLSSAPFVLSCISIRFYLEDTSSEARILLTLWSVTGASFVIEAASTPIASLSMKVVELGEKGKVECCILFVLVVRWLRAEVITVAYSADEGCFPTVLEGSSARLMRALSCCYGLASFRLLLRLDFRVSC